MTNYTSKKATRIIAVDNAIEYKVGQILTLEEIGNHWTGYEVNYNKPCFDDYEQHADFNYIFEVKDVNVRVVNYLDENEAQDFACYSECEVHMPASYKFEVVATDLNGWEDCYETYEEAYENRCDCGCETITLKILNNEEKTYEFDLDGMIEKIWERMDQE